jgi:hypothetical protein
MMKYLVMFGIALVTIVIYNLSKTKLKLLPA